MHGIAINFTGDKSIFTHPIYVAYQGTKLSNLNLIELKQVLGGIEPSIENLSILAYVSTLIRAANLIA